MKRIAALLSKDLAELRHSPGIFVPAVLTGLASVLYPFVIAIIVPYFAGERLSDSSDFEIAVDMYRTQRGARTLSPEGAVQAFIFQHALILMVGLTTVTGSMSVAAHSVIGEKVARTLEMGPHRQGASRLRGGHARGKVVARRTARSAR